MTASRDSKTRRRGGIAPIQTALQDFLTESGLGAKLRDVAVYRAWKQAVGSTLAARTKPVRFADGVLEIAVQSAAHLDEFSNFTGESFRKKANQRLGSEKIRRVVFRLER